MTTPGDLPADEPLDGVLQAAVLELRAPLPARAAARSALRDALAQEARSPRLTVTAVPRTASRWQRLTAPRTLRTSPLMLAAAALLLVTSTALVTRQFARPSDAGTDRAASFASAQDRGAQAVRFTLAVPGAHRVSLVGDFNAWDPTATALHLQDGTWSVIIPVSPGRHQYGFVVDGSRWIPDPSAPQSAESDYGSANSVLYVGG